MSNSSLTTLMSILALPLVVLMVLTSMGRGNLVAVIAIQVGVTAYLLVMWWMTRSVFQSVGGSARTQWLIAASAIATIVLGWLMRFGPFDSSRGVAAVALIYDPSPRGRLDRASARAPLAGAG